MKVDSSIPITFEALDTSDNRFIRGKIWILHTGLNLNNSVFDKDIVQTAIPSLANIPVVGFIRADSVNENDFAGHEQRLVIDENGVSIEYLGRAYGICPESNNAKFEKKLDPNGVEREYLTAEVLIWTKFTEAADIINRDGVKNHSMELYPASIKGNFQKDKSFKFTEFKFDGLCLLGDDITPAMKGSLLEKFSDVSKNTQFQQMLREFNTYFSQYQKSEEGGNQVDEKLELFAKFPDLSEDVVSELKNNLDQYSLEELENKLNELAEKNNFSLTAAQLAQELRIALSENKYQDRWGDDVRAFWYIDHDDARVYAEDSQDSYRPVGLNYTVNGDAVSIDYASKKRIKFVPQDMEGDTTQTFAFVSEERNEFTEETYQKKVNDLEAFKATEERKEKLEVVKTFSELTEDDVKPILDSIDTLSKDEVETKLFALMGKKNFTALTSKPRNNGHVFTALSNFGSASTKEDYLELVDQYKAKTNN